MTAIWSATRAFGGPNAGGGKGRPNGGGNGKKNKAPTVPDAWLDFDASINDAPVVIPANLHFDRIGAAQNAAPLGQPQDLAFVVSSAD